MPKTPLDSVRKFCVECVAGEFAEVAKCSAGSNNSESYQCALFPYRMGCNPKPKPPLSILKSIRKHCLDCEGNSPINVKDCSGLHKFGELTQCPLVDFRFGHNPRRKGLGNKNLKPPVKT